MTALLSFSEDLAIARAAAARLRARTVRDRWRNASTESMIEALRRWSDLHGGQAPRRRDLTVKADPDHRFPRTDKVSKAFEALAHEDGARSVVRCSGCAHCGERRCPRCGQIRFATEGGDFCSNCGASLEDVAWKRWGGHCDRDVIEGMSGWEYALHLAGLSLRTGGDGHATAAQKDRLGRNRQMVTGLGQALPGSVRHIPRAADLGHVR